MTRGVCWENGQTNMLPAFRSAQATLGVVVDGLWGAQTQASYVGWVQQHCT